MDETFSQQDLLDQAQGNAVSFLVAMHDFLAEHGISFEEWARFAGMAFAPGWDEARGDPGAVARWVALNMASLGCTVGRSSIGEEHVVDVTWPRWDDAPEQFASRPKALQGSIRTFEPIAERQGVRCAVEDRDGGARLTISADS